MPDINIRPLSPAFAAEATGVDVGTHLSAQDVVAIDAGMTQYAVMVFRDQKLDDEQLLSFGRRFGDLELSETIAMENRRVRPEINDVSNLDADNNVMNADDRKLLFSLGNQLWHSDSSFKNSPASYSLLSARIVPASGGNTEFADMRAAYDALDEATKQQIENLICEHSLKFSRELIGFSDFTAGELERFRPVQQRLVRTHPVSGRKSLFLSAHAGGIVGWKVPQARALLRELTEHATQPCFVHAHVWRPYDLVIWDNRQTMHRGRRYDTSEVRDLRRTTVAGGPTIYPDSTILAGAANQPRTEGHRHSAH